MGNKITSSKRQEKEGNCKQFHAKISGIRPTSHLNNSNSMPKIDDPVSPSLSMQSSWENINKNCHGGELQQDLFGLEIFLNDIGHGQILEIISIDDDQIWTLIQLKDGRKMIVSILANVLSSRDVNERIDGEYDSQTNFNTVHFVTKL